MSKKFDKSNNSYYNDDYDYGERLHREKTKKIKRGKSNEFQLTDAIQQLIENDQKVLAIPLENNEVDIDVGNVKSYRHAIEFSYKYA